jgi:TPR repeat protein
MGFFDGAIDDAAVAAQRARAARLFERGCDLGSVAGCGNLGYVFKDGLGVPRDTVRAIGLLTRACDAGGSTSRAPRRSCAAPATSGTPTPARSSRTWKRTAHELES